MTVGELLDRAGVPSVDDRGVGLSEELRVSVLIGERDDLLGLLQDAEPFVGWLASVPDIKARIATALGRSQGSEVDAT